MDKYIGRRLDGRYLVDELVGIGGMANVYKATDVANGRTVAVKILRDEYVQNGELLRRFKNESKAVALLSHPNIVKVYDVNFSDRVNYIVMEYIDGVTLKDYMEHRGALDWKETLYFTVQILRALQHAHDNGIVHRDIKPQNIMLLKDGSIKVTDFGIARFARSGMHTMTDKAIGSVHYISPEQARGEATDNRADLYSVGVMMYEMLTGRLPFEAESAVGVAIKHIEEAPVPPSTWNLDIPAGLESIVLRAMQKDPADRYASAAEMLRDIDSFKKDPSISFEYRYRTPARAGERLEKEVEDVQQEQQRHSRQEGIKGAGGRAGGIAAVFSNKKKAGRRAERNPSHSGGKGQPSRRRVAVENEQLGEEARKSASSRGKGRGGSGLLTMLVGITCAFVIGTGIFVGTMFLLNNPFERVADIKVPNLIGLDYDTVQNDPAYADYNIVISQSAYNADYPRGADLRPVPGSGPHRQDRRHHRGQGEPGHRDGHRAHRHGTGAGDRPHPAGGGGLCQRDPVGGVQQCGALRAGVRRQPRGGERGVHLHLHQPADQPGAGERRHRGARPGRPQPVQRQTDAGGGRAAGGGDQLPLE